MRATFLRRTVIVFLYWAIAMTALLAMLVAGSKPRLVLRASPMVAVAPARVYLRALIEGEITEEWYCPALEWTWPDGTKSTEESDCEPWPAGREAAQRIWTRRLALGPGEHQVAVEMSKAGRVLGRDYVRVSVHGGE